MPTIRVILESEAGCRVEHVPSKAALEVRTPPEFGGPGGGFSSTDLVAAALGACIGTSLAPVAARHGISPGALALRVEKTLSSAPKRIARLTVIVRHPGEVGPLLLRKLERAAAACPVHRSLAADVAVEVRFEVAESGPPGSDRGRRDPEFRAPRGRMRGERGRR